jgi:hypothetical protein
LAALRIVVTGLAATYPFGGVFWDYLQYVVGFRRLGHEVLYVEDSGRWCYDPDQQTFVEESERNAAYFAREIVRLDPELAGCWFFRDADGKTYGRSWEQVAEFCRSADLFINISASCWMREEYFAASRVAFIDSDPMYTQASVRAYLDGTIDQLSRDRIEMLRRHDVFFTFGENVGDPDCRIPTDIFDWIPTRQPIVLGCFTDAAVPIASRRRVLTTVASWEPSEKGPVIDGVAYRGKSVEFERFITLPSVSALPLELAMSGPAPIERLRTSGWQIIDAYSISADPWAYRDYLARSFGEWSVAKNAYVASRSGWFSCRSACYLALGVPVIVQDTGFTRHIPSGEGILTFSTLDEAREAIAELVAELERHARAARAIAQEYFASDKVLGRLIEQALAT